MEIQVIGLTKKYNKDFVLENINLRANSGDRIGIVGINGVGKSTLLKCIFDPSLASSGRILSTQRKSYKDSIFIADTVELYPYLTVHEQFRFFSQCLPEHDRTLFESEVEKLVSGFNLKKYNNALIKNLSLGTLRKVYVSSLIALDSQIYLLDEPTNGLDSGSIIFLREYLCSPRFNDKILIMTSHQIDFIQRAANRRMILIGNSLIENRDPLLLEKEFIQESQKNGH